MLGFFFAQLFGTLVFLVFLFSLTRILGSNFSLSGFIKNTGGGVLFSTFFPLVLLALSVSFVGWGVNLLGMATFLVPLILSLVLRGVVMSTVTIGSFPSFSHSGSPITQSLLLYFIHLLSGLIMPLSLIIRFLLNLGFGCILSLFLVSHSGLLLALVSLSSMASLIVYEGLILVLQGTLISFLITHF